MSVFRAILVFSSLRDDDSYSSVQVWNASNHSPRACPRDRTRASGTVVAMVGVVRKVLRSWAAGRSSWTWVWVAWLKW